MYFVRHGQSQANVDKVFAGSQLDSPLTALGMQQAKATAQKLRGKAIDVIISSPLKRAHHTARIIARDIGHKAPVIVEPLLTERDYGAATGIPWDREVKFGHKPVEGVESLDELAARARQLLEWLQTVEGERILVVSHGSLASMFHVVHAGQPSHEYLRIEPLENAEVREYILDI